MAGHRLLISLGSDGVTEWARLPSGQRMNLGPISVMAFVTAMVGKRHAPRILDAYLQDGEAFVNVDEASFWEMLTPRRSLWAGDGPFMACDPRPSGTPMRTTMPTIHDDLKNLETHIAALNKHAGKVTPESLAEGHDLLTKLATKIKSPNQSKNDTYYGLGAPDVVEVGDAMPKPHTAAAVPGLAFDVIEANTDLAQQILTQGEKVIVQIDKLAGAGRKFNASRAKADIHAVTSKVAGILKKDLSAEWVAGDLTKLAAKSDQIHALFFPKS